jgi:predicted  nucleic acid-binding Zn-ribbon protein
MSTELESMVELQKAMLQFDRLTEKAEILPQRIAACKAEHDRVVQEHEKVIQGVKQAQVDLHQAEIDLKAGEEAIAKKQTKLHEVKNNTEYKAALHEIETTKQKNSEAETRILELMDAVEVAKAAVAENEKRLAQDKREYTEKLKELEEELASVQRQMDEFGPAIDARRSAMKPQLVAKFDRIYRHNGGNALASVNNGFCGYCQVNMPPIKFRPRKRDAN